MAMAVDENGDLYVIDRSPADCGRRPRIDVCDDEELAARTFAVRKFAAGSTTPTEVLSTGLVLPTSIAVNNGDIYIADGKRVLKLPHR